MKRRILLFLAAVSLLLWLVVVGVWVRGWWGQQQFDFNAHDRNWAVILGRNQVCLVGVSPDFSPEPKGGWSRTTSVPVPATFSGSGVGTESFSEETVTLNMERSVWPFPLPGLWYGRTPASSGINQVFSVAYWVPAVVFGVLPAWQIQIYMRRRRRIKRVRLGLCTSCGYDLRASVDRCPECGAARRKLII